MHSHGAFEKYHLSQLQFVPIHMCSKENSGQDTIRSESFVLIINVPNVKDIRHKYALLR